jgi:uncharacterized protein YfeS
MRLPILLSCIFLLGLHYPAQSQDNDPGTPFGNEPGSEAANAFYNWRPTHLTTSPVIFLKDLLDSWHSHPLALDELDTLKIKAYLIDGVPALVIRDEAVIGTAFAQFKLEGKIDAELKYDAARTLQRELLPVLASQYGSPADQQQHIEKMKKLLAVLNQAYPLSYSLNGTWQLISGTMITKGVSSVTDYTKGQQMIKIINDSHFAFLSHDLNPPADSSNHFDAGGGSYTLTGDQYIEHLDYYKDRNWEGKTFTFTVTVQNDTLIQKGIEKVEKEGIDRIIIEKYIRLHP